MLTEKQIIYILENKLIARQTKEHKKQIFAFAFGEKYMSSKDKGRKKVY
tara:strand:+ start:2582 stop:2728 length:147 start_codon:yes stop_codon:yes gene_type:complete